MTPKERAAMQQALNVMAEVSGLVSEYKGCHLRLIEAIKSLREALAEQADQEPVACKRCNGTGLVSDGKIDSIGGELLDVPIECVKDCPDCAAPVQQAEQEPVALLQLAADALVYHTEQTRPIQNTIDVVAAIQKFKEKQR